MEKLIDEGGAAFPCAMSEQSILNQECEPFQIGMTLRDYYAGKALEGMLCDLPKTLYGLDWETKVCESAFRIADEMIKARYRQDISDR